MEKVISTVSNIFRERYGAMLKINRNIHISDSGRPPLFMSHWQSSFVYSRTLRQVSFPIFNSKKELQAIATASPVDNKDAIVFDEMAQFLQLTIAEHFEVVDRAETQHHQAVAVEKIHAGQSKVIELKTRKIDLKTQSFEYKKPKVRGEISLDPIWISGENESFNAHIAFSIHDWLGNWAFINAKEIPDLIWQDPNSWENFPQVTIFIPKLETLSEENLGKLRKNLAKLRKVKKNKPFVVVSSAETVSAELELLKTQFKHHNSNKNMSARVQAHFLLYHTKKTDSPWVFDCKQSDSVYFLPFTNTPKNIH